MAPIAVLTLYRVSAYSKQLCMANMHLYSLGLTGIIGLFVVLMVVPAFSKEISKAASESVAIGLSQALEQQVVNLHTKILKTKHAFVSSCFIFVLSLLLMFVTMIIF